MHTVYRDIYLRMEGRRYSDKRQMEQGKKRAEGRQNRRNFGGVGELLAGGAFVEIRGRYRVKLGGVGRILCYSDTKLIFELGQEIVTVEGERLECVSFCYGTAIVAGHIGGVHYGYREESV